MATIKENLNAIKDALYGSEVRDAIHDSIETCYTDVTTSTTSANVAAANADSKAALAEQKAMLADTAAANADSKAEVAEQKATLADTAAANANEKAALATEKAAVADTAAKNANDKAALAEKATADANAAAVAATETASLAAEAATEKASLAAAAAMDKATLADAAAKNANAKATIADTAAANAEAKVAEAVEDATLAINDCNTAVYNANVATSSANRAAERADTAAGAIEGITATHEDVGPDGSSAVDVTEVDGHKNFHFVLKQGKTGAPFIIKGDAFATLDELEAAIPTPEIGDQYNVGTEAPYEIYRWTGTRWESQGLVTLSIATVEETDIDTVCDTDTAIPENGSRRYLDFIGLIYLIRSKVKSWLNNKVDKVSGKGLSTNDFTNAHVTKLDTLEDVTAALQTTKVDKVTGKALSTNDFTNAYKTKVDQNAADILTKATALTYTAQIPADGWGDEAPYTNTVSVADMTADTVPIWCDILPSANEETAAAEKEAWGRVEWVTTGDGTVTVSCYNDPPTTPFEIAIKAVR